MNKPTSKPTTPPGKLDDIELTEREIQAARIAKLNKLNREYIKKWEAWVREGESIFEWEPLRASEPKPTIYDKTDTPIWGDTYDEQVAKFARLHPNAVETHCVTLVYNPLDPVTGKYTGVAYDWDPEL